ncbi:ribonuclease H-like domain-containing protein [Tanacetum coccineum]
MVNEDRTILYATLKEQYDSLSSDYKKSQFNLVSYKAGLESVEARLAHYKKNEVVFEESINVLKLEVRLRDNALDEYKMKLEKAEKERDQLKQTLEKFQNSSKSLNDLLESQVIDKFKTGLGYNAATAASPAVESFVNLSDKSRSDKGYQSVPPPSFEHLHYVYDKKVVRPVWNNSSRVNHKNFANKMTHPHPKRSFVPQAVLTRSGKNNIAGASVNTAGAKVNTVLDQLIMLPQHKLVKNTTARDRAVVSKNKGKWANAVKALACCGNPQQKEYKEKAVIDSGCLRHMTGNKCYLNEYEDYDGGFVSFSNGKGRISGKVPRKDNIYSVDLKSVVPTGGLTCLIAKATIDKSNTWHKRLGHINFKIMNKLVERCDNGTEFKNSIMNQFCEIKGIKREFSVARTPQQNGVAERKNRTLIEAARTMLVDSKLPTTFWAEAVNTACYVLNRVLVIKPHNKTPYELIRGRPPLIDFMKPFGCPVTILNTRDHLGKFDGKADEGYFVGYYVVSKAMRVFNKRTMIVEETLNIRFLKNTPNVKGNGPDWLFDVDSLTISMNYVPVVAGNQTNGIAGTKDNIVAGHAQKEKEPEQEYILIPLSALTGSLILGPKDSEGDAGMKPTEVDER